MMKKLAAFIVLVSLLNIVANAEEYQPSTIEPEAGSDVSGSIIFDVTVPTSLPIYVSSNGEVATASGISITNNSTHSVKISSIEVTTNNGWNILNPGIDIAKLIPGGKGFQLEILGISVDETGILTNPNTSIIASGESLEISYSAHVQTQTDSLAESVADISFTVDWSEPVTTYEIATIPELVVEKTPIESENVTLPDEDSSIKTEDSTDTEVDIKEDIIDTPLDSDTNQGEAADNPEESKEPEVESELKPDEVPEENLVDTPNNSEADTENTENNSDSTVNPDIPSDDIDKKVEIDIQNTENTPSISDTLVEPDSSQGCVELGSTDVYRLKATSK